MIKQKTLQGFHGQSSLVSGILRFLLIKVSVNCLLPHVVLSLFHKSRVLCSYLCSLLAICFGGIIVS